MSQANVSFIIANFNGLEHLADVLDSIRAQSYFKDLIEIILVDNNSDDNSVSWVKSHHPDVRIIENKHNEGFAAACNKGAAAAAHEWLAFVNNDMRLAPDWTAEMLQAVDSAATNTACAGSKILSWDGTCIDFTGGILAFYGHAFQKNFGKAVETVETNARPAKTLFACGGAMLVRKDVFLEVGGFDEDYFAYFEDVDFGWRLWLLGYEVVFVPLAIAFHKGFSTAGKYLGKKHIFLCERNALYTIYKNYAEENLQKVLPAALILLVHRALLHADVASLELPGKPAPKPAETGADASAAQEGKSAKILRLLGESGVKGTIERAQLSSAIKKLGKEGLRPISEEGLSILAAVPHLISNLDNLNKKREFVQANRKKTDAEIFSLFREPFKSLPETADFERLIKIVSGNFGVEDIFGP